MITKIGRPECRLIRQAIEENLAEWADEQGLIVKGGAASSSGSCATIKVEFAIKSADGKPTGKQAEDFTKYQRRHGIPLAALGAKFTSASGFYRLVGYRPRADRFPFVAEDGDGNR